MLPPWGGFGGLGKTHGMLCGVTAPSTLPPVPVPELTVPTELLWDSQTLQECQKIINNQQRQNCPIAGLGFEPSHGQLGASTQTAPCSCCSWGAHQGPQQKRRKPLNQLQLLWWGPAGMAGMARMPDHGRDGKDASFGVTTPSKPAAMGSAGPSPWLPSSHTSVRLRGKCLWGSAPGQALDPHPHSFVLILFVSNIWPGYGDS